MKTSYIINPIIAAIFAIVAIAFSISLVFAWTSPAQTPPAGNTAGPVNVSTTGQTKAGTFWAGIIVSDSTFCIGGSCISSWPADSWTLSGTSIYYTGGKVGIGTALPETDLDVTGFARLAPQAAAPVACDATHKGSIAVASGSSHICVCNGTSWIFNYNSTSCAWGGGDTTPPTVSITAPSNGATVSGTTAVSATASDNIAVVGVQFKLDGANLNAEDTTSPYSISWNTTSATNGAHTLTAVARDAAGNTTTSTSVNVTVNNVVPGSQNYTTAGSYNFTVPTYNTLTVTVWGGGGSGSVNRFAGTSGAASSFNGAVVANGGTYGYSSSAAGGTASGGDTNTTGNASVGANGASAPNGGAGGISPGNGSAPGGAGGSQSGFYGGGSGGYSTKTYSAGQLTVGSNISVMVGGGGTAPVGAGYGATGRVYISWN